MIKVTNNGSISMSGTPEQLLSELSMIIKIIHNHMEELEGKEFADKMIAEAGKIALASDEERKEMIENLIEKIQDFINEEA